MVLQTRRYGRVSYRDTNAVSKSNKNPILDNWANRVEEHVLLMGVGGIRDSMQASGGRYSLVEAVNNPVHTQR